jgi:hypothetical protein
VLTLCTPVLILMLIRPNDFTWLPSAFHSANDSSFELIPLSKKMIVHLLMPASFRFFLSFGLYKKLLRIESK